MDRPRALAMTLEFHSATDRGRIRSNNEDSIAIVEAAGLMVLADGMGGYNAGEVASGMATAFIEKDLGRWLQETPPDTDDLEVRRAMDICVDNANRSIFEASHAHAQYAGMGTTLVMGVFRGGRLLVGHIGDSRAYRWRDDRLQQLTRDHSLLQEQIDAGLISPEQAAYSHQKNLVTRAMGVEDIVLLEIHSHAVHPGDWYLLCSDGLSDMLDDARIATVLREQGSDVGKAAQALVDAANQAGGRDNIAVILVAVHAVPSSGQPWWPFRR
jgi:protein phosphatase